MLLFLLAYLGGVLTILSPCILPVLPFVFARGAAGFRKGTLPLLAGMVLTFALVATLASLGGEAAGRANETGRWIALILVAIFGLTLLFPALGERLTRPLTDLGNRLSNRASGPGRGGVVSSLLLGVATGLLWAPCAGPILGIILTAAALNGASAATAGLLFAYALGAATSLAAALLLGDRVFRAMKGRIGSFDKLRRAAGLLILISVGAIALGLDTRVLARISTAQTSTLEGGLARLLGIEGATPSSAQVERKDGKLILGVEGQLPPFDGTGPWFNSAPLTREQLRGKVVLIDFWTYSCINCIRTLPYTRAWHERYARDGLVIIGVHAPEFAFERNPANVARAIKDLGVPYPVVLDNEFRLWRAFDNRYWPAHYFIDAAGRVRYHHFGEGGYEESEEVIRTLLAEAKRPVGETRAEVRTVGTQQGAAFASIGSQETYLGYDRAERFVSPGGFIRDRAANYRGVPAALNDWSLAGTWTVGPQSARSISSGAALAYRFKARDLHLVLGSTSGRPIPFRITLNGKPPGPDAGLDVAADGSGVIRDERLYQLVRQKRGGGEADFRIEFLEPGVEAFAFTFG